jgi:hypothetical protein
MPNTPRPRTVLRVAKNADGDVVISTVVESGSLPQTQTFTVQPQDIPVLIGVLREFIDGERSDGHDLEDSTTARSLRPIREST